MSNKLDKDSTSSLPLPMRTIGLTVAMLFCAIIGFIKHDSGAGIWLLISVAICFTGFKKTDEEMPYTPLWLGVTTLFVAWGLYSLVR